MPTKAEIILDSISPAGIRLTTIAVEFPSFILAELNTHRMFSRSYASSRAIPVDVTLQRIDQEPFVPTYWGKSQKGMQANEECSNPVHYLGEGNESENYYSLEKLIGTPEQAWLAAKDAAIIAAVPFRNAGYHKQLVNRLVEPFSYVTGIITATEWDNFFTLRLHPDAQPEFQELARCMKAAMDNSAPTLLNPGEWHLPYVDQKSEAQTMFHAWYRGELQKPGLGTTPIIENLKKLSAARCARASFASNQRGQNFTIEQDLALYDRLFGPPLHAGPFEHQAMPMQYVSQPELNYAVNYHAQGDEWERGITHSDRLGNFWSSNFKGWIQQRNLL